MKEYLANGLFFLLALFAIAVLSITFWALYFYPSYDYFGW